MCACKLLFSGSDVHWKLLVLESDVRLICIGNERKYKICKKMKSYGVSDGHWKSKKYTKTYMKIIFFGDLMCARYVLKIIEN